MFYYFPHMRHRLDHRHIFDAVEMEMPGQLLNRRALGC